MPLFSWKTIDTEQLNPSVGRQCIYSESMTVARLELRKDAAVPEHAHHNEQISIVERGALKFFIDGGEQIVRAGEILTIPPNVPHGVLVLEDSVVLDLFSPPREDWRRGDDAYLRK
jgi:quercetin dioxygenase-like cupin family protein